MRTIRSATGHCISAKKLEKNLIIMLDTHGASWFILETVKRQKPVLAVASQFYHFGGNGNVPKYFVF